MKYKRSYVSSFLIRYFKWNMLSSLLEFIEINVTKIYFIYINKSQILYYYIVKFKNSLCIKTYNSFIVNGKKLYHLIY